MRSSEKVKEKRKRYYERHRRLHRALQEYGGDILSSVNFRKTKEHIQHGNMTVNRHCINVARYSLILNKKLGLRCNKRDLVRGSLLHDYFLYDWHDKEYLTQRKRLHGFRHPMIALENADKEYQLTDIQRDIIKKHMWPLSVVPPTCREAWVVTAADKYCSLMETIGVHKGHGKTNTQQSEDIQSEDVQIRDIQSEDVSLEEALLQYSASDFYPYHMPGHKRSQEIDKWSLIYQMDITEIDGFDNLHQAEGILLQAQERAAVLYGAEETFFLVNGSTCGVLSAISAVTERGDTVLIARNCHKSVYHAAFLQELRLRYLYPGQIREYGIADAVSPEEVEEALLRYPECKAVVITSPTYEGIIADVRKIAQVVHQSGKILIVDEAHGAHLGMVPNMPQNAARQDADLVINSLHKTLPAMTQTALLHVNGERVNRKKLKYYLSIFQTSSPSYVFMANMDSCISYMKENAEAAFQTMQEYHSAFMKKMEKSRNIEIGDRELLAEKGYHFTGWDMGKLVISVRNPKKSRIWISGHPVSMSGQQLYDILRNEFHLQMEMAADSYVLAIMTIMDEEEGWQRLADALLEIDGRIELETEAEMKTEIKAAECNVCPVESVADKVSGERIFAAYPKTEMTIAEAMSAVYAGKDKAGEVLLAEAQGEISGNFINLYPPGIPILVPGEVIGVPQIQQIQDSLRMGLKVQGLSGGERLQTVTVCRRIN